MDQWRELLVREARGDFGKEGLGADVQWFVDNSQIIRGLRTGAMFVRPIGLPTTYDCFIGLRKLIERAVGNRNILNIHCDITQECFPLSGTGLREVNLLVKAYLNGETSEQAAQRLVPAGHILANTGDLAGFLYDHPDEVVKWSWVDAISEDSRWAAPGGSVMVPSALVARARRDFSLDNFRRQRYSDRGILVRCEPASTCR